MPIATILPSVATRWGSPRPLVLKPLLGRLGNQLFQWASAYGIAAKHNASLCLSGADSLAASFVGPFHECGARHAALMPCSLAATGAPCVRQYLEQGPHRFDDLPVDGAYVRLPHSFLASFRYFVHVESAVRRRLRFRPHLWAAARAAVARSPCVRANPHAVLAGVHVRRTDRAHQQRVPDAAFFAKAMAHLRATRAARGVCFVVASDDVEWCRAQRVFAAADVHLVNESQPGVALATLARCDDHVVSVGTFGWWGAWLGRGRGRGRGTVVHFAEEDLGQNRFRPPRLWFKKQYEQAGVAAPALVPMGIPRDYFPQDWVAL